MKFKKYIFNVSKAIVLMYFIVLISMFFMQEKLLFHPQKTPENFKYQFVNIFEEKFISVDDLKIHSLYFLAKKPKGTILYFHGNGCELRQCGYIADELVSKTAYNVWIFDYPGYGKSDGAIISEQQLHNIAIQIYSELIAIDSNKINLDGLSTNDVDSNSETNNIILFGRSLGSGIATKLASHNKVKALILETPYYSIKDLALSKYPFVPPFLLKYNFRSDLYIPNVDAPTLVFHGDNDQLIPIDQAQRLSKLAKNLKFVKIQGGTHDDLSTFSSYWSELEIFLNHLN